MNSPKRMGYIQSFAGRFTRTARPFVVLISFCLLLSFFLVLYKSNPAGPGRIQRLDWQSWDIIAPLSANGEVIIDVPASPGSSPPPPSSGGEKEGTNGGVDWFDVPEPQPTAGSSSLPLDQWAPLLPHDTGITEIAITRCLFDPRQVPLCWPSTTNEEDAVKGPWVRVERDLNIRSGIFWLHLYYRRTRRLDVPLITEIRLLGRDELSHLPKPVESWTLVDHSIRDGVIGATPLFLHYKLGPSMKDLNTEMQKDIITEIDVLHGYGPTWYGFDKVETPVTEGKKDMMDPVWLMYRKGVKPLPPKPRLHFSHSGEFKIMQIADLHYSVMRTDCIDTVKANCTDADGETATLISGALDAEKPDLVVFTGDQLNGGLSSWDSKSILAKFAEPVIRRKIPWAAVLGNHDAESDLKRDGEIGLLQMLPYSLVEPGPKDISGAGNYVLKVHSADASKTHLLTLYFLDSGAYSKGIFDWFGFHPTEYDWIKPSQIDWFLAESAKMKQIVRPFTPDGGKDMGNAWKRDGEKLLGKPNAMMFFHIPLPESYYEADVDPSSKKVLDVGQQLDPYAAAKTNGGLFEKGLLLAKEVEGGKAREVKVVANGHCHVSDNCRRVLGVWLCFGGGGAFGGYSKPGFDRRFRIYKISEYGEKIETYKRTERGDVIDNMVLAGPGAPGMGPMSGVPR